MKKNIFIDQLLKQAESDKILFVEKGKSYTASQIYDRSITLASGLQKEGLKAGDTAVIATMPGIEFLQIIYATMLLGVKVAIIDPEMGRDNYMAKIRQLQPQWGFIDYRLLFLQEHPLLRYVYFRLKRDGIYVPYNKGMTAIATGNRLPIFQKHIALKRIQKKDTFIRNVEEDHNPSEEYIITYTSGTLNEPKGVVHTFESIGKSIEHITSTLGTSDGQSIATHLPHYMLLGVCAGIKVHVWDKNLSAAGKIEFITKYRITTIFGPPVEIQELIQHCEENKISFPKSVQHILMGSAPIHVPFLKRLISYVDASTRLTCLYGMTENLVIATIDGREKVAYGCKGDVLGDPMEGVALKIAVDGEILIKSCQMYSRYLHQADKPEWHKSGDLGYIDAQGKLILTGRKKDMIIRKDFNIYPALYETTIKNIPSVTEAVLIGKYSEDLADEVVYLCVETSQPMTKEAIHKQLLKGPYSIDQQAIPDHIIFCEIPRSGRQFKIDRKSLRDQIKMQ